MEPTRTSDSGIRAFPGCFIPRRQLFTTPPRAHRQPHENATHRQSLRDLGAADVSAWILLGWWFWLVKGCGDRRVRVCGCVCVTNKTCPLRNCRKQSALGPLRNGPTSHWSRGDSKWSLEKSEPATEATKRCKEPVSSALSMLVSGGKEDK